ncbi:MAG: diaminopimelate epimerase [Rubrobacteraceae bacterium]
MRFAKMHGVGNDFLVFDRGEVLDVDLPRLARLACDRHFGVGADGILVPQLSAAADFRMVYLNSDGSVAEMCGNGIRCLARYARDHRLVDGDSLTIETEAGIKKLVLYEDGSSRVDIGTPAFNAGVRLLDFNFLQVSVGNPHAIAFLESEAAVEELNLGEIGPQVEKNHNFPGGTNVEFVSIRDDHDLRMRIWERGAGETLGSGTGSGAVAVAALRLGLVQSPVRVHLDGGSVEIEWSGEGEPAYMTGPAEYVCEGRLIF